MSYKEDAIKIKEQYKDNEVYCQSIDWAVQDLDATIQDDEDYCIRLISSSRCYYNVGLDELPSIKNGTQMVIPSVYKPDLREWAAGKAKLNFKKKPYANIIYVPQLESPTGIFNEGVILMAQII